MTSERLDGSNYLSWRRAVKTYLLARDQVFLIERGPQLSSDPSYDRWRQEDAMVRTLLWQSMASHISRLMMELATAKDIWEHAALMFSGVDNLTRICTTYSEWIGLDHRDLSLSDHYSRFITLCQRLDVFMPLTLDLTVLGRQRDQLRAISFGPELLTIPLAANWLMTSSCRCTGSFHRGSDSFGHGHGTGGLGQPYCTHCQRDGHRVDTCFLLHPELRHSRAAHLSVVSPTYGTFQSTASDLLDEPFEFTRADYEELQRLRL
ncbi:uncharacterized protein LOC143890971 [Tasmannia lanceolata]|uniref:uncharacterized protein LOC143890971 n=1 Tax=Tasmannia lanceolata TaxID=3420 RepID=UPI004064BD79